MLYMKQICGKSYLEFSTELIIFILHLFNTESNYITIVLFFRLMLYDIIIIYIYIIYIYILYTYICILYSVYIILYTVYTRYICRYIMLY